MDDFIRTKCIFGPLTQAVLDRSYPFVCGKDPDMDDFFKNDAVAYDRYRMGKSYCFISEDDYKDIVTCFTVSNDSLRIYDLPNSRKNAMWSITNREKMLSRFPGILIGRLAVSEKFEHRGIGSQVIDFLKYWFSDENDKSACRFLIVDAKNDSKILDFYKRNGFEYLFTSEMQEDLYTKPPKDQEELILRKQQPRLLKTRLMYYDLLNNYQL